MTGKMTVEDFIKTFEDGTLFEIESRNEAFVCGDRFDVYRYGPCFLKRIVKSARLTSDGVVSVALL